MANHRSFKSDTSFLEKISIGAIGTRRVFNDLRQQGHAPIELERGSMSFKIWKAIKIKRIRVPDILCIDCGRRVESRAKTKLQISMSHSFSNQERGWDYGLADTDYVGLATCHRVGERPIDWEADELVQYVSVKVLRDAQNNGLVVGIKPKGAEEGFEARITWPASIASSNGVISKISEEHLQYRRSNDSRTITLQLFKQGLSLEPLVREGDIVTANQVLSSVVPVTQIFPCSKDMTEAEYVRQLSSSSLSERYTASKALSFFKSKSSSEALALKVSDTKDHIYVRLESAASLARRGDDRGIAFIEECLSDQYLENRLEAIIVLGEIGGSEASTILINTLRDDEQHPEIRSGAAWALGGLQDKATIGVLVECFANEDEGIRIEAARALAKIASEFTPDVISEFPKSQPTQRPGIAWALSKSARFTIDQLLNILVDDDARRWAAYIIGTQDPRNYIDQIEALRLKDTEVYFASTVLWQIMSSWVFGLEEYG